VTHSWNLVQNAVEIHLAWIRRLAQVSGALADGRGAVVADERNGSRTKAMLRCGIVQGASFNESDACHELTSTERRKIAKGEKVRTADGIRRVPSTTDAPEAQKVVLTALEHRRQEPAP
jgi:hypothetical protein